MPRLNSVRPFQVGDRPGNLEYPVIGPAAQSKMENGRFEEVFGFRIELAERLHLSRGHPGVAMNFRPFEARLLGQPCPTDPLPDQLGTLPFRLSRQLLLLQAGNFNMKIYPVEQWSGEFSPIVFDPVRGTDALFDRVEIITARTWPLHLFHSSDNRPQHI